MKEQNAWVAVAVVVIVAIVAGYFGMMAGGSPAYSPASTTSTACGFGTKSCGSTTPVAGVSDYEADLDVAQDKALETCNKNVQEDKESGRRCLADAQVACTNLGCVSLAVPNDKTSSCKLVRCVEFTKNQICTYKFDSYGNFVQLGSCELQNNDKLGWLCLSEDGYYSGTVTCTQPVPVSRPDATGQE